MHTMLQTISRLLLGTAAAALLSLTAASPAAAATPGYNGSVGWASNPLQCNPGDNVWYNTAQRYIEPSIANCVIGNDDARLYIAGPNGFERDLTPGDVGRAGRSGAMLYPMQIAARDYAAGLLTMPTCGTYTVTLVADSWLDYSETIFTQTFRPITFPCAGTPKPATKITTRLIAATTLKVAFSAPKGASVRVRLSGVASDGSDLTAPAGCNRSNKHIGADRKDSCTFTVTAGTWTATITAVRNGKVSNAKTVTVAVP